MENKINPDTVHMTENKQSEGEASVSNVKMSEMQLDMIESDKNQCKDEGSVPNIEICDTELSLSAHEIVNDLISLIRLAYALLPRSLVKLMLQTSKLTHSIYT